MNLYNDIDPKACAWTQELINAGRIPPGKVLCKSITEIEPDELDGFTQLHFFNGISGWARALDLAGWPTTRPVWCASLPCQPFSCAGKQLAQADERHLWPVFFRLVQKRRPECIFGEQVQAAIGLNWLDGIFADLEAEGYTCGAVVLGAHSVGAPHIRQRLYWMAYTRRPSHECELVAGGASGANGAAQGEAQQRERRRDDDRDCGTVGGLAIPASSRPEQGGCGESGEGRPARLPGNRERDGGVGDAECRGRIEGNPRDEVETAEIAASRCLPFTDNFWSDAIWHACRDGKQRRIPAQPAFFPLVNGLSPERVGILRGAGNAIVPQVAAQFIQAAIEAINEVSL